MKVVLFQPQIPQNCGNVVRTCAVTGCGLILIRPLGFSTSSRWLKRAGLDYWEGVNVELADSLEEVVKDQPFALLSSKAETRYTDIQFTDDHLLIFGSETSGLPEWCHNRWQRHFATIPMKSGQRCLNLATSVGIVVYEASRQLGFTNLQR